ncbi:MAG: tRNA (N(6)-L-threonylcarbamoyladenosine(37)-C(2))-methylthiotransferase MtaB [Flavobacteriales bacterium]|nr:tRNA (N(6)-L-threonylcarbamoyladenosine(37)-C(2))-methylthiotransferase MtaB [Flavobacteriales bacterium]
MLNGKKVAYYTLGCKLNFSETSTISRQLEDIGFIKTNFDNKADLYVINTCSVTENANKECRRIIRKVKRTAPESMVVITGCYAQLKPESISVIEGVDMVVGANDKFKIPDLLKNYKPKTTEIHGCSINNLDYHSSFSLNDRTRSFLKIQDGCDYTCSYCTIPFARGKSRCDSIENIVANANKIAKNGIKEIVITGVNIGDYKYEDKKFIDVIKELEKVKGITRFRISSIEPNLITDEIIEFVRKSSKFMPHFHIPLQSGSDVILAKMRRRYNSELYRNKILKIYNEIPNVSIGVDVIVGFPDETDIEFTESMNFIKDLPVSYLHVFSYSERENTKALLLKNPVDKYKRSERSKILRMLSSKLQRNFYLKSLGTTKNVLFEQEDKNGFLFGFTENYIKIKVPFNKILSKTQQEVYITDYNDDLTMNVKLLETCIQQ